MQERAARLSFERIELSEQELRFHYLVDDREAAFSSTLDRPLTAPSDYRYLAAAQIGLAYLVDLASLTLPETIIVKPIALDAAALEFWRETARQVAIEHVYARRLDPRWSEPLWRCTGDRAIGRFRFPANDRLLLGMGGGKESLTALDIFKEVRDFTLFFLSYRDEKEAYYRAVYDFLAPRHAHVNVGSDIVDTARLGSPYAENFDYGSFIIGHVAFNALLYGDRYAFLALGNEYSANFANAVYKGRTVNHQYEKTAAFAEILNDYINTHVNAGFTYFSPFFGAYEYKICEMFFRNPAHLGIWTSCNNVTDQANFCAACPKCAFTYLVSLPFIAEERLNALFDKDVMNNLGICAPLVAFDGEKPLDCVGEKEEAWLALAEANRQGKGRGTAVMRFFLDNILPAVRPQLPEIAARLTREQFGFRLVPPQFRNAVVRAFGDPP